METVFKRCEGEGGGGPYLSDISGPPSKSGGRRHADRPCITLETVFKVDVRERAGGGTKVIPPASLEGGDRWIVLETVC